MNQKKVAREPLEPAGKVSTKEKKTPTLAGEGQRETSPGGDVHGRWREEAPMLGMSDDADMKIRIGLQPVSFWLAQTEVGRALLARPGREEPIGSSLTTAPQVNERLRR